MKDIPVVWRVLYLLNFVLLVIILLLILNMRNRIIGLGDKVNDIDQTLNAWEVVK